MCIQHERFLMHLSTVRSVTHAVGMALHLSVNRL